MMNIIILAMLMATAVMAGPTERISKDDVLPQEIESNEHLRFRRVTCDLLGFTGHAACAAHCLTMGKAGGYCDGAICICRSDTFTELWDKKFPPHSGEEE